MNCGDPIRLEGPRTVTIPTDWAPTAENINALPGPLRAYIHDLVTTVPADLVRENWALRRQIMELRCHLRSLDE